MAEPDTDRPVLVDAGLAAKARLAAAVGLALLAALIAHQILGRPLASLGAFLGAGAIGALAWGPLVMRPTGIAFGGAALTGVFALAAAYVGAGLLGAGGERVITDRESAIALLFSFWIVLPVMVAAAIGIAVVVRMLAERRGDGQATD